jgi:hypothetical protein
VVRFYRQASHLLTPLFQSNFAPLGWARDAFMGLACRLPVSRGDRDNHARRPAHRLAVGGQARREGRYLPR